MNPGVTFQKIHAYKMRKQGLVCVYNKIIIIIIWVLCMLIHVVSSNFYIGLGLCAKSGEYAANYGMLNRKR